MTDPTLKHQRRPGEGGEVDPALAQLFEALTALAHECTSGAGFYRRGFRLIAEWLGSPYACLSVRHAGTVIEDHWHTGPADPGFWRPAVEELLTSVLRVGRGRMRQFRAKHGALRLCLLSAPVLDATGKPAGAIAACVPVDDDAAAHRRLCALSALTGLMSFLASGIVKVREERHERAGVGDLATWRRITECENARELAFRITNDLRNRLGCEQVALGIIRRQRARILSISGLDHVAKWSPGVRSIRSAMEECYDHGGPIVCRDEDPSDELRPEHRVHRQWSQTAGGVAVASVPFRIGSDQAAVLCLRAQSGGSFDAELIENLIDTLTPVVTAMPLLQSATRTLVVHAVDASREHAVAILRPQGRVRAIVLAGCLALAGWCLFGTMPYRVSVTCNVIPATLQHVVAPFDGTVRAAHVAAGDEVVEGQPLYELDTDPLLLERRRLLAELEVSRIEVDRALAADAPAEAQLAAARRRVTAARLAVVDDRLARAAAHASFSGTVLEGDLRTLLGQSVEQGEPLYLIAPKREWLVELEIPESSIDEVRIGQVGRFACDARPEQRQPCEIVRLLPRAQVRDGRNVFVAEARVEQPEDWVRPGMEGVVQLEVERRPVWWVATHRLVDFIRRKLWL